MQNDMDKTQLFMNITNNGSRSTKEVRSEKQPWQNTKSKENQISESI